MSKGKETILVVDDEPDIRRLVQEILQDEGYQVFMAADAEEARQLIKNHHFNLILLDIWMPDTDGITLLKEWQTEQDFSVPVIMMSGHGTIETAVDATKLGAYGFLEKPLSLAKLLLVVQRGLTQSSSQADHGVLKSSLLELAEPIGPSVFSTHIKEQLKRLAQYDTNLMFVGECGVGKGLYARYLQAQSVHKKEPFIRVLLGQSDQEQLAIEIFGQEKNGECITGALENAYKGLLLLSDIRHLGLPLQAKLLAALQSGFFMRVGGLEQVAVECRIVTAVKESLLEEVRLGNFRQDLYFFLNEVEVKVLPLREHREDVPALLSYYVDFYVQNEKLAFREFSMPALNFLRQYTWSGNVRELKNLVQRLMILGVGTAIELAEIKTILTSESKESAEINSQPAFFELPLKEAREQFEKAYLLHHFNKNDRNVAKLAASVGVERTHLYRKLHALNIKE